MNLFSSRYYPRKFFKNNHEGIPYRFQHRVMRCCENPVAQILLVVIPCFIFDLFVPWEGAGLMAGIFGCIIIICVIGLLGSQNPYQTDRIWSDQGNICYSDLSGKTIARAHIPVDLLEDLPDSELVDRRIIWGIEEYMYYTRKAGKLLEYAKNHTDISGDPEVIDNYKKVYEWYMGRAATVQEHINTYLTSKAEAHKQKREEQAEVEGRITGVEKLPAE
jgi:hypothetical protein